MSDLIKIAMSAERFSKALDAFGVAQTAMRERADLLETKFVGLEGDAEKLRTRADELDTLIELYQTQRAVQG